MKIRHALASANTFAIFRNDKLIVNEIDKAKLFWEMYIVINNN